MALRCLLAAAAAAVACAAGDAQEDGVHLMGDLWHKQVLNSDDVWAVVVLERDSVCGDVCDKIRKTVAKVDAQAQGIVRLGWAIAHDTITTLDGSEEPIKSVFNITTIPHLLIFSAGAASKRLDMTLKLGPESAAQLVLQGPKILYENLKQFLPSTADSVRSKYVDEFLGKESPSLPRVLLLSKTAAAHGSAIWKRAGLDFSSRAVFGHALLEADGGALAAAFGVDKDSVAGSSVVLVSGPGPHPKAPVSATGKGVPALPANSFSGWQRFPPEGTTLTYPALKAWLDSVLPAPPVPQLSNQRAFEESCNANAGSSVCFIALLPSGAEEAAEDSPETAPLAAFRRVAGMNLVASDLSTMGSSSFRAVRLPASFSWIDASQQEAFADAFKLPGIPALIALNPRKKVFAAMRMSFNEANVRAFVEAMADQTNPNRIAAKASLAGRPAMGKALSEEQAEADAIFKRIQLDLSELVSLEPLQGGVLPTLKTQVTREQLEAALGGIKGGSKKAGGAPAKKAAPKKPAATKQEL